MARIFKRKPDGVYYIDYHFKGRRLRESTGTKSRKEAEKCLHSRMGEVVQGKFKLESVDRIPHFKEFSVKYMEWAKENKRSWERDFYSLKNLLPVFGDKKLAEIHPFHVESYKIQRKSQVKPATVNREVALLKRILNLAIVWRVIQANPIRDVKLLKEPRIHEAFLSEVETSKLIEACKIPLKWIVITALHTGMRRGEILNMKWENINLKAGYITITETKNGEIRHVPLNQTMKKMIAGLPRISNFVFAKKDGSAYAWINRSWRNAKVKADINCRFHDLRHTYASHLVMNGVDLMTVKELLGHKTLAMIQRYAHLSGDHKQRAVEKLDNVFSGQDGTDMAHLVKLVKQANA